ncbi:CYTH and CHAD domain-containing protein [Polaromonas sp. CG_9.11]|uniref:CYTH and CHAD domain-containing protein n=1 Tax=Polaromonas sp. CG_9.11 TaxID=2787730 RepID=UPI0018CB5ACF|nr:CYTH and CHAD domain-containing protein [Polaromonas sp. CG_9.11]MBG6075554.1 inorganic triphosphatase YgiF [Polaromonas sp. CG_9.11]
MKSPAPVPRPEEIELKLALPTADPQGLVQRLARTPLLARRKPTQQPLHNIYYDTPGQDLYEERVALRLRRVGSSTDPQWRQTLKMGGRSDSALSHRGEWEVPLAGAGLSREALEATPWPEFDPDGSRFDALAPCLVTAFERTSWSVRRRGGSVVEVSLDIGQIVAGDQCAPLCELELELMAGKPAALFEVAQQIARSVAVLPLNVSKAERGYALLQERLMQPLRARPPALTEGMPLPLAAQSVLREMFCQFTSNLKLLGQTDDPEVLHQARVGWRRFRSAVRLFKPGLAAEQLPDWQPLAPLLDFIGELRDIDVARTETLPSLAEAYRAGNAQRAEKWQAMLQALSDAAGLLGKSIAHALEVPAVGATLLAITQWLEDLPRQKVPTNHKADASRKSLRRWARQRTRRLHRNLQRALADSAQPESLHRARLLAKRLRYAIEALWPLLPRRQTKRWLPQAIQIQADIGGARDLQQASVLAARLEIDTGLAEFLRGVVAGQPGPR